MNGRAPHFVLYSEVCAAPEAGPRRSAAATARRNRAWRFVLQTDDGRTELEAKAAEPEASGDRLSLLAVVRGLEALDQPSRVTLITPSGYVRRGLRFGLAAWRENGWQWERFGKMAPIKHRDLWRRVDQALRYHDVECRLWRFDSAHDDLTEVRRPEPAEAAVSSGHAIPRPKALHRRRSLSAAPDRRWWPRRLAAWLLGRLRHGPRQSELALAAH